MTFINTAVALVKYVRTNSQVIIKNTSWELTSLSGLVLAHYSSISLSGSPIGFPLSSTQFSLRNWLKSSQIFFPLPSFSGFTYIISTWFDQILLNDLKRKWSRSCSHAPSIWYDAVAHDHLKPSGNWPPGIRSRSALAAQCLRTLWLKPVFSPSLWLFILTSDLWYHGPSAARELGRLKCRAKRRPVNLDRKQSSELNSVGTRSKKKSSEFHFHMYSKKMSKNCHIKNTDLLL